MSPERGPGSAGRRDRLRGGDNPEGVDRMKTVSPIAWAVAALVAVPVLSGCASEQALRMSLSDRDREIQELNMERTRIQEELVRTRNDRDRLQAALQDAAARLADRPEPVEAAAATPIPRFRDLDEAGITYGRRGDHIVFSVPSAVTFGAGKAELTSAGEEALLILGRRLTTEFDGEAAFYVEGHTDSDPISKSKIESNRHLSLRRAMAVHEFLVTEGLIQDERFVLVGHGPYRPLAANDSDVNKALNRRVEIVVHETGGD